MAGSSPARGGRDRARAGPVEPGDDQPRGRAGAAQIMSLAGDLTTHVVGFCRRLRARDLPVGPKEAADALRALAAVDVSNRRECYLALRTVLTSRYDDLAVFDEVFREFWNPPAPQPTGADQPQPDLPALASDGQTPSLLSWLDEALQSQGEESIPAYSPVELLTQKDFSTFTGNDLYEVSRLVVAIARRVATRLSRRMRAVRRGHALDLRRTIRNSLCRGGEIVEIAYRKRRIQKTRVALVADTCDIDVLDDAMRELHARAGRVIWLNPLLGSPGYEPICQGMRVALPYVDVFASAHNLESLRQLERHLALKRR